MTLRIKKIFRGVSCRWQNAVGYKSFISPTAATAAQGPFRMNLEHCHLRSFVSAYSFHRCLYIDCLKYQGICVIGMRDTAVPASCLRSGKGKVLFVSEKRNLQFGHGKAGCQSFDFQPALIGVNRSGINPRRFRLLRTQRGAWSEHHLEQADSQRSSLRM